MANSKTIAGLIGPSLIALAAALLINLGSMSALVEAVSHDPALVLVSGVLSFVAGLAVVRVHNHWADRKGPTERSRPAVPSRQSVTRPGRLLSVTRVLACRALTCQEADRQRTLP